MDGDWITLALFLFFFVILPILQGIAQRRKGQTQELPEADAEEWMPELEEPSRRRRLEPEEWTDEREEVPVGQPPAKGDRSAWEELGLDDIFGRPDAGPRSEPSPVPAPAPQPRPAPAPEPRPQPRPEPRWEPRAQPQLERPVPPPMPRPAPPIRSAPPEVVSLERLEVDRKAEHAHLQQRHGNTARAAKRPPPSRPTELADARRLRRAIILSEVLGPPRALKELEPRG